MSIGYACLTLAVPGTDLRGCMQKNADSERLYNLINHNLDALEKMVDYNIRNGILLFRISSDLIPFASSHINSLEWDVLFRERLLKIGEKIQRSGMRVSMHPGQYTVLNAINRDTAERSIDDLRYHAKLLGSLCLDSEHKIILHVGGEYGDKESAKARFCARYKELEEAVCARLVIENDDKSFNIGDVLEISARLGIPAVYDNLHNSVNPCDASKSNSYWIDECKNTWAKKDGTPKIHYSQQDRQKKPGSHAYSIQTHEFLKFYEEIGSQKPDIMLEVKDKNISALKCILVSSGREKLGALETEWGRYKYLVLERSPQTYSEIRAMLKNKSDYQAVSFFRLIEHAMQQKPQTGDSLNAAMHVWGYFKDVCTQKEKADFLKALEKFKNGDMSASSLKRKLYKLAQIYKQDYLLYSYYFI